ncbi:Chromatin target of PRMT1 protein C-terminal domain-containing protein [Caenorhabditis elegans]|uniref:Chromatin target of PRMT1 protein C-terminal domain-containing protein n=1 Tax=Caenorhabditis elegans TaxID=6239 RepID=Q9N442_CAEEL|nr:Chromatin target of PRMT1 protein C-terminal domain-containing protein [Caenorhabditis elegans]CCD68235.1 Chromatin target of PRMT1 protein C-terminal domain-containing protein [Caenorhabditis elegans]|eukprot:NP_500400.1 Uncharacterized protein CELE_Y37E11AL.9 [Caenorhabditis elegans]
MTIAIDASLSVGIRKFKNFKRSAGGVQKFSGSARKSTNKQSTNAAVRIIENRVASTNFNKKSVSKATRNISSRVTFPNASRAPKDPRRSDKAQRAPKNYRTGAQKQVKPKREARSEMTIQELDAELDIYMAKA